MASADSKHPRVRKYEYYKDGGKEVNRDASLWDVSSDDLTDGLPDYSAEGASGQDDFASILNYFKYLLNVLFIVLPMAFFEFLFLCYNLYFNAVWNRMWANGNVYLMANTAYLFYQCFISIMLALEYPFFMRSFRLFRFFSLLFAIYYNMIFGGIFLEWYRELYLEDEQSYEQYDVVDVLFNMFLVYNVILHFPVVFVNGFIIMKEVSLEFWQFLVGTDENGNATNDMALGFWDMVNLMDDTMWFIDPRTYLKYALDMFLKWGFAALLEYLSKGAFSKE